jgi:16S rRNA (cytosine967-C5)-methyltransferase
MNISPARTAAFDVLYRIETEKAFSSVLLSQYENQLSQKDRALCHEIVLGVLRRQIYLDKVIDHLASKPQLDREVRLALRIGIFQLLFLYKVPDYSAINESVNLIQRAKKTSAKGLVNAVLRRSQRESINFVYEDEFERISVETSHPRWLIEKWTEEFGVSETEALAKANNFAPRIALRLTAGSNKAGLEPKDNWARSELVDSCFLVDRIDPELSRLAESGDIYFQDEASQMVGSAVDLNQGAVFLDCCAAPGGKTTLIASRYGEAAQLLAAGDLHWRRVKFLKENCERQGEQVSTVQYDAEAALPFADEAFDAVLVDAPCSGTGTIPHNPEIRYSLKPTDFAELYAKQLQILENASKLVKPGGRIYYSTCSLETEENEGVISQFLVRNGEFRPIDANLPKRFVTEDGFVRTNPHRDGMDGFFLAVLEKGAKMP